jgi:hypothetical protein
MKILFTIILAFAIQSGWTQTKISIADGDWNNPLNWNPAVVPVFNEDTVIVNHQMTLSNTLEVGINHLIIGTDGSVDVDGTFALHGNFNNDGRFLCDSLVIGDGNYCINNNLIEAHVFIPTNPLNENYGTIDLTGFLTSVESFLNADGAIIQVGELTTTSDADFVNNGAVYVDSWICEGTVLGSGSFCIENCFKNFGAVNGTLDVCDLTPNSGLPCDLNIGTTAPTVTLCAAGPCTSPLGVNTSELSEQVSVFPNPSSDGRFHIETDQTLEGIAILDLTGRVLFYTSQVDINSIDLSSLGNGEYLLVLETSTDSVIQRIAITK